MSTNLDYRSPSRKFKSRASYFSIFLLLIAALCIYLDFNFLLFFTDFHYLTTLMGEMTPPNFSILLSKDQIILSIFQTISMAFLGTLIGGSIAIFLAFFAARNTTNNAVIRTLVRTILSVERVIPSLVIILVFLIAVGLGPFAGMLSLAVGTVGMFGKLFADSIEHIESDPIEAIYAVGASKIQAIRYGIIPQVMPSFIANLFYALDINLRAAIGLGIFGGGGIGFEIHMAMQMLRYKDALALIFFTIVLICAFEKLSDYLRSKVMEEGSLK